MVDLVCVAIVQVLGHVKGMGPQPMTHDMLNCMFQLIASGHDDAALKTFLLLVESNDGRSTDMGTRAGEVLVRTMVIKGRVCARGLQLFNRFAYLSAFGLVSGRFHAKIPE